LITGERSKQTTLRQLHTTLAFMLFGALSVAAALLHGLIFRDGALPEHGKVAAVTTMQA